LLKEIKEYATEVLKAFRNVSQIAGNKAKLDFNLEDYSTKEEVLAAVDRIRYLGENTNTTGGLKVARLEVFGSGYDRRPNVDKIIVLITDGVPTYDADKLDDEVAAVKADGIRLVALGVTNKVILHIFVATSEIALSSTHTFLKLDFTL